MFNFFKKRPIYVVVFSTVNYGRVLIGENIRNDNPPNYQRSLKEAVDLANQIIQEYREQGLKVTKAADVHPEVEDPEYAWQIEDLDDDGNSMLGCLEIIKLQ